MKLRLVALLLTILWVLLLLLALPFTLVALPFVGIAHLADKWADNAYESAAELEDYQGYDYEPWPEGAVFYFLVQLLAMMVMSVGIWPLRHSLDRVSYYGVRAVYS